PNMHPRPNDRHRGAGSRRTNMRSSGWIMVPMLLIVLGFLQTAHAATFTCTAGDVACLIAAINTANVNGQANTITLAAGTYSLTVVDNFNNGPNGLPAISSRLTVTGAGAGSTIIAGNGSNRLIFVTATGN